MATLGLLLALLGLFGLAALFLFWLLGMFDPPRDFAPTDRIREEVEQRLREGV